MRAKRMIFLAGFFIGLAGIFRLVKQAQTNGFVVNLNFRQPSVAFGAYTCVPAFVVAAFATIVRIFNIGRFAQITKTIISPIPVDVVNLMRRPFTCHIQPSQTMRKIQHVVQPNNIIAVFHTATRFSPLRAPAPFDAPRKPTCGGVIIDKVKKAVRRKLVLHNSVNINHWRECQ